LGANERVHAAGLTCYFSPAVKIVYEPRSNFRALFYQLSRYGLGRAKLAFKHPKSLSIPALVPPLWAVWALAGGALSLAVPYFVRAIVGITLAIVAGRLRPSLGEPLLVVAVTVALPTLWFTALSMLAAIVGLLTFRSAEAAPAPSPTAPAATSSDTLAARAR
jgi:hypothetical protein